MRNLIVARHGSYDEGVDNGGLTSEGVNQIEELAKAIMINSRGDFRIMSSPLRRTIQSAIILKDILGSDSNGILHELNCEYDRLFPGQARVIHKSILEEMGNVDNLVLMGHYATAIDYSKYFMQKELSQQISIRDIDKGEAIHISLENGLYNFIPK